MDQRIIWAAMYTLIINIFILSMLAQLVKLMNSNYVYLFGTIILILAIILRFTNNGLFSLYGVNTPNAANYVSIGVDILFGILFVYLALQSKVSALAIELVQNAGGKKHR